MIRVKNDQLKKIHNKKCHINVVWLLRLILFVVVIFVVVIFVVEKSHDAALQKSFDDNNSGADLKAGPISLSGHLINFRKREKISESKQKLSEVEQSTEAKNQSNEEAGNTLSLAGIDMRSKEHVSEDKALGTFFVSQLLVKNSVEDKTDVQESVNQVQRADVIKAPKRVLIFTMDSIESYVQGSKQGGPAGEILIRTSLERGLQDLGFEIHTAKSDAEFEALGKNAMEYSFLVMDPWTYAGKGWVPKQPVSLKLNDLFILSFFGSKQLKNLNIDISSKVLTAYPTSPENDFLGYFISSSFLFSTKPTKKNQGVIWGKKAEYFQGRETLIKELAELCELHSTLSTKAIDHPNIVYHQHLTPDNWQHLLAESKFLLGLGDPLLGPSAIDAISNGCVFINPVYKTPKLDRYYSQHPFAAEKIGEPYVCTVDIQDVQQAKLCVQKALGSVLPPIIPTELSEDAYRQRLINIFGKYM